LQYASNFLLNGGLGNYATTANLSDASASVESVDLERTAQDASVLRSADLNSTTKREISGCCQLESHFGMDLILHKAVFHFFLVATLNTLTYVT
jgi:hypothetical protein